MKRQTVWLRRGMLFVASIGLFWLLSEIGWGKILSHLQKVGWQGALLLLAVGAVESMLDALALREAALGRIGFWQVLFVNQAGTLLNIVVPAEAGELFKATLLADHTPGKAASATLVWNVAFRLTKPLVIIVAALVAFATLPQWRGLALVMLGLCGLRLAAYFLLRTVLRRGWIGKIASLLTRLPWFRGERTTSLAGKVQNVEQAAAEFRHHHRSHYFKMFAYQIAARGMALVAVWLILHLLGTAYPFALCALIFAGTQLIGYLLALLPTRVGTAEGSNYLLFSALGLDGGLGVIYEVITRLKQLTVHVACLLPFVRVWQKGPSAAASR